MSRSPTFRQGQSQWDGLATDELVAIRQAAFGHHIHVNPEELTQFDREGRLIEKCRSLAKAYEDVDVAVRCVLIARDRAKNSDIDGLVC